MLHTVELSLSATLAMIAVPTRIADHFRALGGFENIGPRARYRALDVEVQVVAAFTDCALVYTEVDQPSSAARGMACEPRAWRLAGWELGLGGRVVSLMEER